MPKPSRSKSRASKTSTAKKSSPPRPKKPSLAKAAKKKKVEIIGTKVGEITHYFTRIQVGVIKISSRALALSDKIRIKGHTTDLTQRIASMQIDNAPVTKAVKGQEAGIKVNKRVRGGDKVYKV